MAKLDKTKPYGTVHGDDEGRCFVQNGVYFDYNGDSIASVNEPPRSHHKKPAATEGKTPAVAIAGDAQIAAQLNASEDY